MTTTSDDLKDHKEPHRIVSLLPSITEILAELGVSDQIVGITHECDYPPRAIEGAQIVTASDIRPHAMTQAQIHESVTGSLLNGHSLYGLNKEILAKLHADIIFTQSLCDVCAVSYNVVLDTCAKVFGGASGANANNTEGSNGKTMKNVNDAKHTSSDPTIVSLEPSNLEDIFVTFFVAGRALGKEDRAEQVVKELKRKFAFIQETVSKAQQQKKKKPLVAFLEWHDPFFTGGHWIADMMEIAGCDYPMCQSGDRSAPMSDEDFRKLDPDYILIGPCGFSLERSLKDTKAIVSTKPWWKSMRAVQNGNVYALDGNSYYARPGPRLLQGCGLIARCVHGDNVGAILGEELAPTKGMQRVTLDMYGRE